MKNTFIIGLVLIILLISGCSSGSDVFSDYKNFGQKYCETKSMDYLEIDVFLSENGFHVICYDFDTENSTDYQFDNGYNLIEVKR